MKRSGRVSATGKSIMPIYEFQCSHCGKVFEELVRMGHTGEGLNCPACGGNPVQKLMSTFYGRSGSGSSYQSIAGQGCECGGDCGSCGGGCSCHK